MNKKKCLIYDIQLNLNFIENTSEFLKEYYKLENNLNNVLADYKGCSDVQIDIGHFEIREPDIMIKKLLPHIHIIIYGDKLKSVEKKLDAFFTNDFVPNYYNKLHIEDSPFEEDNLKLFDRYCYTYNHYTLKSRALLQKPISEVFI